jgi:hypothetical protein
MKAINPRRPPRIKAAIHAFRTGKPTTKLNFSIYKYKPQITQQYAQGNSCGCEGCNSERRLRTYQFRVGVYFGLSARVQDWFYRSGQMGLRSNWLFVQYVNRFFTNLLESLLTSTSFRGRWSRCPVAADIGLPMHFCSAALAAY